MKKFFTIISLNVNNYHNPVNIRYTKVRPQTMQADEKAAKHYIISGRSAASSLRQYNRKERGVRIKAARQHFGAPPFVNYPNAIKADEIVRLLNYAFKISVFI